MNENISLTTNSQRIKYKQIVAYICLIIPILIQRIIFPISNLLNYHSNDFIYYSCTAIIELIFPIIAYILLYKSTTNKVVKNSLIGIVALAISNFLLPALFRYLQLSEIFIFYNIITWIAYFYFLSLILSSIKNNKSISYIVILPISSLIGFSISTIIFNMPDYSHNFWGSAYIYNGTLIYGFTLSIYHMILGFLLIVAYWKFITSDIFTENSNKESVTAKDFLPFNRYFIGGIISGIILISTSLLLLYNV